MFCKKCGIVLQDDSAFCSNCGYKIEQQKVVEKTVEIKPVTEKPVASSEITSARSLNENKKDKLKFVSMLPLLTVAAAFCLQIVIYAIYAFTDNLYYLESSYHGFQDYWYTANAAFVYSIKAVFVSMVIAAIIPAVLWYSYRKGSSVKGVAILALEASGVQLLSAILVSFGRYGVLSLYVSNIIPGSSLFQAPLVNIITELLMYLPTIATIVCGFIISGSTSSQASVEAIPAVNVASVREEMPATPKAQAPAAEYTTKYQVQEALVLREDKPAPQAAAALPLARFCENCGNAFPPDGKFCEFCGNKR